MFPQLEETFVRALFNPRWRLQYATITWRPQQGNYVLCARDGHFSHAVTIVLTVTGTTRKTAYFWRLHCALSVASVKMMPLRIAVAARSKALWSLACCNCVFEPQQGHKYLCPLNLACCTFAMADPSTRGDLPSVCVCVCVSLSVIRCNYNRLLIKNLGRKGCN